MGISCQLRPDIDPAIFGGACWRPKV
ncbi:hypothetical protein LINGRAHAP2_LOCUS24731 [Linum grandiflorum]